MSLWGYHEIKPTKTSCSSHVYYKYTSCVPMQRSSFLSIAELIAFFPKKNHISCQILYYHYQEGPSLLISISKLISKSLMWHRTSRLRALLQKSFLLVYHTSELDTLVAFGGQDTFMRSCTSQLLLQNTTTDVLLQAKITAEELYIELISWTQLLE